MRIRIFRSAVLAAALLGSPLLQAETVVMGGNPPGSLFYSMSNAIGATVTKHSDLKVDVLPQGGSVFYPMMATQEVDFGLVNPIDALAAMRGEPPYDKASGGKGFPLRTLMLGSPIRLSLVASKDSGVKSVPDLKGKRVVTNYGAFASAGLTAAAVLASHGMSEADVEVVTVSSYPEGVRAVMEGRAVAAVGSIGSGIIQELDASRGAYFLDAKVTPDAIERAQAFGKPWAPIRVKAGVPGIERDIDALSYAITIVVRADLDDAVVRKFIATTWDHHAELKEIFKPLVTWTPNRFASTQSVMPYHPAAVAFYKEKGAWPEAMEKHQAMLSR
jgi:hypothetical protein